MEYTIRKLAELSGVSTRTLRYYDQIGLLCPRRISTNGYRIYGRAEIDLLQQILFYRELGLELEAIGRILCDPDFDRRQALENHLDALLQRKERLDQLIGTVGKTLAALKGEHVMEDNEKFQGFTHRLVEENEAAYGKEIRSKYGNNVVDASNRKLEAMSREEYAGVEALSAEIAALLKEAVAQGDPAGETAQKACTLHREWLCRYWPEGFYNRQAHLAMADLYCEDERFKAYYEAIAPGCAAFLREALHHYCGEAQS